MRVSRLHEPCQTRWHVHEPDLPSAACVQEPSPEMGVACVHQQYRLLVGPAGSKNPAPVLGDAGQQGIIRPSALPPQQAHVPQQRPLNSQLYDYCRRQHVLVTDDALWQLCLDSGVLAEQSDKRHHAPRLTPSSRSEQDGPSGLPGRWAHWLGYRRCRRRTGDMLFRPCSTLTAFCLPAPAQRTN